MSSQRFEGLDAMRVVASFGVVFLHVFVATGSPPSLELLIKLRDFALPFLVMTAFFLLTVSLTRKPSRGFAEFFRSRVHRFWVPMVVWTFVYSLLNSWPDPIVFLTGYRHLWFLQFVFLASLAAYPTISILHKLSHQSLLKSLALCGGAVLLYAIFFWVWLRSYSVWDSFGSESEISMYIFVSQASSHTIYIPISIGLALVHEKIREIFIDVRFRIALLMFAFAAMAVHLVSNVVFTREIYGVAVFVSALLPWARISSGWWQRLAAYSYGTYILHFIPTQFLWVFVTENMELGGGPVLAIALAIYFVSFAAALAVRRLFPANWLIPLVSVSMEETRKSSESGRNERRLSTSPHEHILRENTGMNRY